MTALSRATGVLFAAFASAASCVGDLPTIAGSDAQIGTESGESSVSVVDARYEHATVPREAAASDASMDVAEEPTVGSDTASPSCRGLLNTCGADGQRDCCESLIVPGGEFLRRGLVAHDGSVPRGRVSTFRLDKYKVTVGRFRKFVAAVVAGFNPPVGSGKHVHLLSGAIAGESGWQFGTLLATEAEWALALEGPDTGETWTAAPSVNDRHPINFIDWREAYAFCIWDGGFLPTDLERHYAAAGGDEQRFYPWSNPPTAMTIDWTFASYGDGTGSQCYGDPSFGGGLHPCGLGDFTIPGTKPNGDGRWGHSDLAGTLFELELDCAAASVVAECEDCADLATQDCSRMVRSADRGASSDLLITDHVSLVGPNARHIYLGFRCARPP